MKKTIIAALGYCLIAFPLGYTWHLVLFKQAYDAFGVYSRSHPIIPLGALCALIQGSILAYL